MQLQLEIGNGKNCMLKNSRVSSQKAKAERTLFLAGLRKCWDASEMYEALNLHSECWGHSEFTAELCKSDESWEMMPGSGTALMPCHGTGREPGHPMPVQHLNHHVTHTAQLIVFLFLFYCSLRPSGVMKQHKMVYIACICPIHLPNFLLFDMPSFLATVPQSKTKDHQSLKLSSAPTGEIAPHGMYCCD